MKREPSGHPRLWLPTLLLYIKTAKVKVAQNCKKESNTTLHNISKCLRDLEISKADSLADQITSTDKYWKMLWATRAVKVTSPTPLLFVYNVNGNFVRTHKGMADMISNQFKKQFTDPDNKQLNPFIGDRKLLEVLIKREEVWKSVKILWNEHSPGSDDISN